MVIASTWVGLTFPGMMLLPGSFSGSSSSPSPQRGPLPVHSSESLRVEIPDGDVDVETNPNALRRRSPSSRMSLAIFIKDTAVVLAAPLASTIASCAANASNLFGAVSKG